MHDHPLSIFGWIIVFTGLALLVFWVPTGISSSGLGFRAGSVFNMHKAEISRAAMMIGLVMVIVGTIARGFESLQRNIGLAIADEAMPAFGEQTVQSTTLTEDGLSMTHQVVKLKDRQGKERDAMVATDGTVVLSSITGPKTFSTLSEAKAYLA